MTDHLSAPSPDPAPDPPSPRRLWIGAVVVAFLLTLFTPAPLRAALEPVISRPQPYTALSFTDHGPEGAQGVDPVTFTIENHEGRAREYRWVARATGPEGESVDRGTVVLADGGRVDLDASLRVGGPGRVDVELREHDLRIHRSVEGDDS